MGFASVLVGFGAAAGAKRPLHYDGIDPAAKLEADRIQRADMAKPEPLVQGDGPGRYPCRR